VPETRLLADSPDPWFGRFLPQFTRASRPFGGRPQKPRTATDLDTLLLHVDQNTEWDATV